MKKTWSIMLILSLFFTSAIPAFAAEPESKELEKAIYLVKSIITIPNELTEFSQSSYRDEREDKAAVTVWDLNWRSKDDNNQLYVSVDSLGNFLNYRLNMEPQEKESSKITRQAGEKTALSFLKKVMPEYANNFHQINENKDQIQSDDFYYTYQPYFNDIPLRFLTVNLCVDKNTGMVTSFSRNDAPFAIAKLPAKEGVMTKEEADRAYFKEFGMDLNYYSYYDRKKESLVVFPAYVNVAKQNQALDAKTGKITELYLPIMYYGKGKDAGVEEAKMDNMRELSPQEQAQVDKIAGLISKEEADGILKNVFSDISSSASFRYQLQEVKNRPNKGKYIWHLSYENVSGSVDANTGEILSYYYYDEQSNKGKANLNAKNALEKTEALLKKILPNEKLENIKQSKEQWNEESPFYNFTYYRQANGIDFLDNSVSVTVDKDSGKITQYNCEWYDDVTFPSIEKAMNSEQAYQAYKKISTFSLNYEKTEKSKATLVYTFDFVGESCFIHPENGTRLDWMGNTYKEEGAPRYSDIKGHWCESVVNELKENGYYLEGEKFLPNNKITQKEFLTYLYPYYRNFDEEELYKALLRDGILKKGEENPKGNLSRQEAAKFMIRYLSLEKAAERPELFQSVFKDQVEPSYKGYATLSKGLGILSGDKYGKFNGTIAMTRAETASAIYRLLNIAY